MSLTPEEITQARALMQTIDQITKQIVDLNMTCCKSQDCMKMLSEVFNHSVSAISSLNEAYFQIERSLDEAFLTHVRFEDAAGKAFCFDSQFPDLEGAQEYMEGWKRQDFKMDEIVACEAWIELPQDKGWVVYIGDQEMNNEKVA